MTMKRYILILSACLSLSATAMAQGVVDGVKVENLRMEHVEDFMVINMNMDMKDLKVESNRAVVLTPTIVNGVDSLVLNSVGVYGRTRYYQYLRGGAMITGESEKSYRSSEKPDTINYRAVVPYEDWMDGSHLKLNRRDYGCCKNMVAEQTGILIDYLETAEEGFMPIFVYVRPVAEKEKTREIKGQAYIDFPVNKMVIIPDYRRNTVELAKIQATIDSVKNDDDITITSLSIKGYASPESSYANNTRLAKGRTAALKAHVEELCDLSEGFIQTSYEPEDWAGLRAFVLESDIDNKDAIVAIIDSEQDPDRKEAEIKKKYPNDYSYLLQNCYPALRHSDYKIEYKIRSFTDVEEIKRVFKVSPGKLSLNEFYMLAETYEPGSDEFNDVFDVAARVFPTDPIANLNEANTAMQRGNLDIAKKHLDKAGDSPEAVYARGAYAAMCEDYTTAVKCLEDAEKMGVSQATETLAQVRELAAKAAKRKK